MKIPGALWGGIMVALPLLSVWIETYFGAYGWTPAVAGLLLIIVKTIEVYKPSVQAEAPMLEAYGQTALPEPPSRARRWLVG